MRRVIRALEVYLVTGTAHLRATAQDATSLRHPADRVAQRQGDPVRPASTPALTPCWPPALLDEVRGLRAAGYVDELPSMSGLGYRQFLAHLDGKETLEEAVARVKKDTRRFVRQQSNWFREDDATIAWFEADDRDAIVAWVDHWLER